MPLNYSKPIKKKVPVAQKVSSLFARGFSFIYPSTLFVTFLLVAIILAFIQIQALYFYVAFGVFIVGYFAERILMVVGRYKLYSKKSTSKPKL